MKLPPIVKLAALATLAALAMPLAARAGVQDPWLGTDKSIDSRSARSIVAGLVRDDMSDEEKVLAIFHWTRRVLYHSGPEEPLRHDFDKMINIFGYGSCYMQTHPLSHLLEQVGFPTKNWIHDGHHMLEVFYDGQWHCLDPHMSFYAYSKGEQRHITSIEENRKDPALVEDAVKDGRTGPAYLICGDKPTWFTGDDKWVLDHPFLPHNGSEREFGGVRLPRGTTFVRTWKEGKFLESHAFGKGVGPYHTCGVGSDKKDKQNWPFWEPYADKGHGRHHGTGYLDYQPDLRGGGWRDGVLRYINLVSDKDEKAPALHPKDGGLEAEAIFFIDCPYVVTAATLELQSRRAEGDKLEVAVSTEWAGRNRKWKAVEAGTISEAGVLRHDLSGVAGAIGGYWVRITMTAKEPAKTGLNGLKVHTDFQLNPYVLPQLLPGPNKLSFTAGRADGPWGVRVSWSEGENWATPKEYKAAVTGTNHQATIEAAGPKLPRMETIEFMVAP